MSKGEALAVLGILSSAATNEVAERPLHTATLYSF
jgi:hypothetical protein